MSKAFRPSAVSTAQTDALQAPDSRLPLLKSRPVPSSRFLSAAKWLYVVVFGCVLWEGRVVSVPGEV